MVDTTLTTGTLVVGSKENNSKKTTIISSDKIEIKDGETLATLSASSDEGLKVDSKLTVGGNVNITGKFTINNKEIDLTPRWG